MTRLLVSLWTYRLVRWAIAAVFLAAGIMKAFDPGQFVELISDFGLLPESLLSATAFALIAAEVAAGTGLLWDVRGALGLTLALLLVFLGVLSYGMALGLDIDCGCFGPGEATITLQQAWYRDLALLSRLRSGLLAALGSLNRTIHMATTLETTIGHNRSNRKMDTVTRRCWAAAIAAGSLALACAAVVLVGCEAGKNKFEKEVDSETVAVKLARETLAGQYDLVTTDELKNLIDAKTDMLIVDTMPFADSYRAAHVPGARQFLFPKETMDDWDSAQTDGKSPEDYQALLGEDKDRLIVIYCGYVTCARSHNGAMWAKKLGYTKVRRHPGGIYAWKGAKYPTEKAE